MPVTNNEPYTKDHRVERSDDRIVMRRIHVVDDRPGHLVTSLTITQKL
jgi:hypothetical protein